MKYKEVYDDFNGWLGCARICHLELVRPGKVQCICDDDPEILELHSSGKRCWECVNEYGYCVHCGFKDGVACICDMTFAEKAKTVGIDEEALRIFNMGGKGRKRGKDSSDNKRNA